MKNIVHRADDRGTFDYGWLKTSHSFNFGNFQHPERTGFGLLRVLNDDYVQPGKGFDTHPHRNMEIVSIPLQGELAHKDSAGHEEIIRAHDVQVMSAGSGILHSEYNPSDVDRVNFLQIWIHPDDKNHTPRYEQKSFPAEGMEGTLQFLVAPGRGGKNLWLHQKAYIARTVLRKHQEMHYHLHAAGQGVYIFVIDGEIRVHQAELNRRDAIGIWDTERVAVQAVSAASVLFIEVPMTSEKQLDGAKEVPHAR